MKANCRWFNNPLRSVLILPNGLEQAPKGFPYPKAAMWKARIEEIRSCAARKKAVAKVSWFYSQADIQYDISERPETQPSLEMER